MDPLQLYRALEDAINRHDLDGVASLFDVDCEYVSPSGLQRGRHAVRTHWQHWFEAFPDERIELHDALTSPESGGVVAEYTESGTFSGTWRTGLGDFTPTARRYSVRGVSVIRVRDDRITSLHVYVDDAMFLSQIGLIADFAAMTS